MSLKTPSAVFQETVSAPATAQGRSGDIPELKRLLTKAYGYSEINRLREKIVHEMLSRKQKTIMVTSPRDGTGNTFLVVVLGYSAAYFSGLKVLLVDLNMRHPELHIPFSLNLENGFTDLLIHSVPWTNLVKPSGLGELEIITAGKTDQDLSFFLNRPIFKELLPKLKEQYDLIILDTSPVLVRNRNNVDPVYLSTESDAVLVLAQGKRTTKEDLRNTVTAIQEGGGEVKGIVFNQQYQKGIFGTLRNGHAGI
jgi:capsular exopolysaccharide synthesis family protein